MHIDPIWMAGDWPFVSKPTLTFSRYLRLTKLYILSIPDEPFWVASEFTLERIRLAERQLANHIVTFYLPLFVRFALLQLVTLVADERCVKQDLLDCMIYVCSWLPVLESSDVLWKFSDLSCAADLLLRVKHEQISWSA